MKVSRRHLILFLGLLAGGQGLEASDHRKEISFRLYRDYLIVVQGTIGSLERINFLIDTGSPNTAVDQGLAAKLGLPAHPVETKSPFGRDEKAGEIVIPELGIGALRCYRFPALVIDLSNVHRLAPVDAIIGLDLLSQTSFTIDYETQILSFGYETSLEPLVGADPSPFPLYFIMPIRVKERLFQLVLDTAANNVVFFENQIKNELPVMALQKIGILQHLQGMSFVKRILLPEAFLGAHSVGKLPAVILPQGAPAWLNVHGFTGLRPLGLTRVHLNFPRQLLSWDNQLKR